ncbi:3',5'-cyclic-AMP phosphodiesterase [Halopseudomonas salina]|uniref:3',5'-cyclic adenosine monophosphate phosphodiesterase CpdA n=1 Tax=Halopseudomonas salina TaxID=1323744 RepID=A0ABQ1PPP8_9GAMM|nr:3',5'-cyclic-AMP phosphodiesterase [Halopseudomonas salina]GGD00652.1 3',5'-cyclic adenosine monophosphate phosphodiesterase CpdA [Halopseudomonas salina]
MLSPIGNQSDTICIVQLTDSHLYADPDADLLGLDTHASLRAVVDLVRDEVPQMDLVLATGDIAQDGNERAYHRFIEIVDALPAPCCWIPGNHDDAAVMARIGADSGLTQEWVDAGNWRIVLLDSSIPGTVAGHLAAQQLSILQQAIDSAGERFVMVCLHHHPVPIGCDWMDPLGLLNANDLWARLHTHKNVKVVLWGHIHQELDQQLEGIRLLATPSTCVQFASHSSDFATDTQAPGYRTLMLLPDGQVETSVSRLESGRFLPDPGAVGY